MSRAPHSARHRGESRRLTVLGNAADRAQMRPRRADGVASRISGRAEGPCAREGVGRTASSATCVDARSETAPARSPTRRTRRRSSAPRGRRPSARPRTPGPARRTTPRSRAPARVRRVEQRPDLGQPPGVQRRHDLPHPRDLGDDVPRPLLQLTVEPRHLVGRRRRAGSAAPVRRPPSRRPRGAARTARRRGGGAPGCRSPAAAGPSRSRASGTCRSAAVAHVDEQRVPLLAEHRRQPGPCRPSPPRRRRSPRARRPGRARRAVEPEVVDVVDGQRHRALQRRRRRQPGPQRHRVGDAHVEAADRVPVRPQRPEHARRRSPPSPTATPARPRRAATSTPVSSAALCTVSRSSARGAASTTVRSAIANGRHSPSA